MKDPILLNKLWKEVEAGNVVANTSGDLTLFKYTQDCHIQERWNETNRQARGIIFRVDGTVVARPFPKFFNMNERAESMSQHLPWKEGVEIYEKMDGSCGIGYYSENISDRERRERGLPDFMDGVCSGLMASWRLATPGSLESDQAVEGTRILNDLDLYYAQYLPTDCTPVFEIVYPDNRIVVDYQGATFLSLLAIFDHNGTEWHPRRVDQIAQKCGFHRPRRFDVDLLGELTFPDNFEGYVARFDSGLRVKVKSPTYLRIHRLLNHLSPKGVVELIRGSEYGSTVKQLPDSIACDFDDVRAYVQGMYSSIFTDAYEYLRHIWDEVGVGKHRKQYAEWIIANVPNAETGFVFALLDDKDIEDKIWKLVLEKVKVEAGPRTQEVL